MKKTASQSGVAEPAVRRAEFQKPEGRRGRAQLEGEDAAEGGHLEADGQRSGEELERGHRDADPRSPPGTRPALHDQERVGGSFGRASLGRNGRPGLWVDGRRSQLLRVHGHRRGAACIDRDGSQPPRTPGGIVAGRYSWAPAHQRQHVASGSRKKGIRGRTPRPRCPTCGLVVEVTQRAISSVSHRQAMCPRRGRYRRLAAEGSPSARTSIRRTPSTVVRRKPSRERHTEGHAKAVAVEGRDRGRHR